MRCDAMRCGNGLDILVFVYACLTWGVFINGGLTLHWGPRDAYVVMCRFVLSLFMS